MTPVCGFQNLEPQNCRVLFVINYSNYVHTLSETIYKIENNIYAYMKRIYLVFGEPIYASVSKQAI